MPSRCLLRVAAGWHLHCCCGCPFQVMRASCMPQKEKGWQGGQGGMVGRPQMGWTGLNPQWRTHGHASAGRALRGLRTNARHPAHPVLPVPVDTWNG